MAGVRLLVAPALAVLLVAVAPACSGDDDDGSSNGTTSTTLNSDGIEVSAPDGWQKVPLPQLGFGVGLPAEWEALVLSASGLESLSQADPVVPGFAESALAAAGSGAVFYAAGVDAEDRVTDLKVRAAPETGVTDAAGLKAYAEGLATEAKLADPTIEVVDGAELPTVKVRFQAQAHRPSPDDPKATVTVPVEGTEYLVLSPRDVVYSLIVTGEQAEGHDAFAQQVFDTLSVLKAR